MDGFNYSENGYYFVTICTQNRWNIFGEIKNEKMVPNDIGKMISKIWNEMSNNYNGIEIDEFILMPDHLHGILVINKNKQMDIFLNGSMDKLPNGRTQGSAPTSLNPINHQIVGVDPCVDPMIKNTTTLGIIIKKFKTLTTKIFIDNVKQNNWPRFNKRLWQRNYYERIIRNEKEYLIKKQYIKSNPIFVHRRITV